MDRQVKSALLPRTIADWFSSRGWQPHPHQIEMLEAARAGVDALLIAPTGGGKTLAGFLPSLTALVADPRPRLHTLYVSPLKALSVDVARNLAMPIDEMALPITVETRTGDTPSSRKIRQRQKPPHMLMTTPESLAILLSYTDADDVFGALETVIVDEVHAFAPTKRGDLLSLGLARLRGINLGLRTVGLSATIADEAAFRGWLAPHGAADAVRLIRAAAGPKPDIDILSPEGRIPWAGHTATYLAEEVYAAICRHHTTIVFVNTRSQTEMVFQALLALNRGDLPIAIHHGSLEVGQRRRVEKLMAAGELRAVVATSSLDLGLDWGAVDLVIQIGAPKGSSRLLQRIGRANHRLDMPSKALLAPGNRFEFLEARAAIDAVMEGALDGPRFRPGGLDVLAQHLMGMACGRPFLAEEAYEDVRRAAPYADLSRAEFDRVLAFVENGGYALRRYDRFRRIVKRPDGRYQAANRRFERQYRMNAGTIIEEPAVTIRQKNMRPLGTVDENFATALSPGDQFLFSGRLLEVERMKELDLIVRPPTRSRSAVIPSYMGGRLALSTDLADRVRAFLADPESWTKFPAGVRDWLKLQRDRSELPAADGLLIETFAKPFADGARHFLVAYPFEGWPAHQSLGMLVTRRMEDQGAAPLGFVATDYVLAAWSVRPVPAPEALFSADIVEDEFVEWVARSSLLKRAFYEVAIISGLVERRHPGQKKTGRQVTMSTDLIYEVLRKYDPDHLLLRASWADARGKLTELDRLSQFLTRVEGRITHRPLNRASPLSISAVVELGKHAVDGEARDLLLAEAESLAQELERSPALRTPQRAVK